MIINKLTSTPKTLKFFKRSYSKEKEEELKSLEQIDWTEVLTQRGEVSQAFDSLYSKISAAVNEKNPTETNEIDRYFIKIPLQPNGWITGLKKLQ